MVEAGSQKVKLHLWSELNLLGETFGIVALKATACR